MLWKVLWSCVQFFYSFCVVVSIPVVLVVTFSFSEYSHFLLEKWSGFQNPFAILLTLVCLNYKKIRQRWGQCANFVNIKSIFVNQQVWFKLNKDNFYTKIIVHIFTKPRKEAEEEWGDQIMGWGGRGDVRSERWLGVDR